MTQISVNRSVDENKMNYFWEGPQTGKVTWSPIFAEILNYFFIVLGHEWESEWSISSLRNIKLPVLMPPWNIRAKMD